MGAGEILLLCILALFMIPALIIAMIGAILAPFVLWFKFMNEEERK